MLSKEEKKNISIKGGEVHVKTGGNSKKRTSEVKKMNPKRKVISTDVTQVPPTKRQFVIIDQDKYSYWLENKDNPENKNLNMAASLKGEIVAPKVKTHSKSMLKKLSEHSLTKMTKRSFQPHYQESKSKT